jgi:2-dehydro-3-deoxygluconokinase
MFRRDSELHTREYVLEGIVDRIGAGDAFVAGLLHGLLEGAGDQHALDFAVAAATLKHSIPGDYCPLTLAEVRQLLSGDETDVKR